SLWPFKPDLAQLHIERLFILELMLKRQASMELPTLSAYMTSWDFRVCRCFRTPDASGCHRWAPEQVWEPSALLDNMSGLSGRWVRFAALWEYYTRQEMSNETGAVA
ncbi:unnamed protein product, partial [Polarella glacialis]